MSQHSVRTCYQNDEVVVVAAYERPLNDLFLQVLGHEDAPQIVEECVLYSSLDEPQRDGTDISTVSNKLNELGIAVPDSLLGALYLAPLFHTGNRMVRHHIDQPHKVPQVG